MSFGIDLDMYWESFRERMENPPRRSWDGPEISEDTLSLDECDASCTEERYGAPLEKLRESDLLDIVREFTGVDADSAKYEKQYDCITYRYRV